MIPVRDNSGNYHETVAIYDNSGREIAEVRDNQGRLLFKNWDEIQGIPPLTFKSYADYLTDYRIYGNTVQDGTPTPENPVEVQGCGERTENFFEEIASPVSTIVHRQIYVGDGYFTLSTNAPLVNNQSALFFLVSGYTDSANIGVHNCAYNDVSRAVESVDGYVTVVYRSVLGLQPRNYQTMLTPGTTPPDHYIPYGYKIPVTVSDGTNSITTPVYIGSEPLHKIRNYADYVDFKRGVVVRRICKVALTGKETYTTGRLDKFRIPITITLQNSIISADNVTVRSSHYITNYSSEGDEAFKDVYTIRRGYNGYPTWFFNPKSFFSGEISSENCARQFKSYLAAQYAAGTPVTIWYVIATPEEEPLENLLPIQTIKGSDVLTVDTTVQPSNIWIKGKIKAIN